MRRLLSLLRMAPWRAPAGARAEAPSWGRDLVGETLRQVERRPHGATRHVLDACLAAARPGELSAAVAAGGPGPRRLMLRALGVGPGMPHLGMVEALLAAGLDPDLRADDGQPLLLLSLRGEAFAMAERGREALRAPGGRRPLGRTTADALLDAGASARADDDEGRAALALATRLLAVAPKASIDAIEGLEDWNRALVDRLLDANADPLARLVDGRLALDEARDDAQALSRAGAPQAALALELLGRIESHGARREAAAIEAAMGPAQPAPETADAAPKRASGSRRI